jgi:hypothetical protein
MVSSAVNVVSGGIARLHEQVLKLANRVSDEQLAWRLNLHTPSIAFHLWHMARWADRLQARIPDMSAEMTERLGKVAEVWEIEKLAGSWQIAVSALGYGDTGMEMSDEMAADFVLPSKSVLIGYLQRTFAALERCLDAIDTEQFMQEWTNLYGSPGLVGESLVSHLGHISRHLGMIEALVGVQGMEGTATI